MDRRGLRPEHFRAADDLCELPVLERQDLARSPERFRPTGAYVGQGVELSTTGTTGHVKFVVYDRAAGLLSLAHGHRQRHVVDDMVGPGLRREMQVDRQGGVSDRLRTFYERNTWVPPGVDLVRASLEHTDPFEDNVSAVNAFRPEILGGVGSYIGALYRYAQEHDLAVHRPRVVRYGGAAMAEADRALLETQGTVVLSTYQAVEALRIGYQCERRSGLHVHADSVAVRIADADGRSLAPGETGDVILSNLVNRGTVLLNYRVGDVGVLNPEPCPCGRTLPTLARLEGRSDDLLRLPDGQSMYANSVIAAGATAPGFVQAQLVQEDILRLRLRVVLQADADWVTASQQIEAEVRKALDPRTTVLIERVDRLETSAGGKPRAFVTHLPTAAH